jgi:excisionase family DNA binding protein
MIDKSILTYKDLQERWGVSQMTARKIVRQNCIPFMRLGHRTVRFKASDILAAEDRLNGYR